MFSAEEEIHHEKMNFSNNASNNDPFENEKIFRNLEVSLHIAKLKKENLNSQLEKSNF